MMELVVSTDEDVNDLFRLVATELQTAFGHSSADAEALAKEYYTRFTDAGYCESIGVPVQDDDFFFHESAEGIALRAQYYLVVKGPPDPFAFVQWRVNHYLAQRRT